MAAPARFDPLIDLDGVWTPELAERYLPIDGAPPIRYEAADGKLYMTPCEGSANSWATAQLITLMSRPAREAGLALYSRLNVQLAPKTWIEPDLVVLREPVVDEVWIGADHVIMPVGFVSPSSRQRDRIDKPKLTARAGIPFYLLVEINRKMKDAEVRLFELADGEYQLATSALARETFSMRRPFEVSFDVAELLEP